MRNEKIPVEILQQVVKGCGFCPDGVRAAIQDGITFGEAVKHHSCTIANAIAVHRVRLTKIIPTEAILWMADQPEVFACESCRDILVTETERRLKRGLL